MRRRLGFSITAVAAALALAACGGGAADPDGAGEEVDGGATETDDSTEDDGTEDGDDDGAAAESGTITVGIPAGWDEGVAVSHLWAEILEQEGYTVNLEDAEIGVIFTSLAQGDSYDLLFDAWLPVTHQNYIDQYGDDIEDLGIWYEGAVLTIAVNDSAPITSLDELADNADVFGNRLVGIDPGAGLTQLTENEAIPEYGLDGMEFVISSTAAMLAELKAADASGDDIVVTLWRPHWAYDEYDIRDLEDPKGIMGDDEKIHTFARQGFADDFPEVAGWIEGFTFSDDDLASLENIMFNENDGKDNVGSVKQWLEENPDFIDNLLG